MADVHISVFISSEKEESAVFNWAKYAPKPIGCEIKEFGDKYQSSEWLLAEWRWHVHYYNLSGDTVCAMSNSAWTYDFKP